MLCKIKKGIKRHDWECLYEQTSSFIKFINISFIKTSHWWGDFQFKGTDQEMPGRSHDVTPRKQSCSVLLILVNMCMSDLLISWEFQTPADSNSHVSAFWRCNCVDRPYKPTVSRGGCRGRWAGAALVGVWKSLWGQIQITDDLALLSARLTFLPIPGTQFLSKLEKTFNGKCYDIYYHRFYSILNCNISINSTQLCYANVPKQAQLCFWAWVFWRTIRSDPLRGGQSSLMLWNQWCSHSCQVLL